jgi:hypothetical protein
MPTIADVTTKGRPQVAVRLDPDEIDELDRLAERGSSPLRALTRADVLRYAITLGTKALAKELDAAKAAKRRGAK